MNDHDCIDRAQQLNAGCQCVSLDRERLAEKLARVSPSFHDDVLVARPHLFSTSMVFVGEAHIARMAALVAAVERIVALPAYQAQAFASAPQIARHEPGPLGVFFGYDFHLGEAGPQLIEINTNAGGGLLNALLERAQKACCDEVQALLPGELAVDTPEHLFLDMFRNEWARFCAHHRRSASAEFLRTVAIVDDAPHDQYLYPEFVLFQRLFEAAGLHAVIADPAELSLRDGALWHGEARIDLVYNRLTDFYFEEPRHRVLREAYLADVVAITPHPRAHALFADKRNLVALCDDAQLAAWSVDAPTRTLLAAAIPRTEAVTAGQADDFWARRRQLFFKPVAGYGSKATYRGDKLTRRVFDEIIAGDYVAQALVPPSQRTLQQDDQSVELKLDLRNYVYAGHVQLVAARLWQGQTTNFRTPGGGFAPVLVVPCAKAAEEVQ
ncbi:MAG: hypothetical protein Q7S85_08445 [Rugosibacter sp.]|nr:hypothetical protein [Rugosibacter sp.]